MTPTPTIDHSPGISDDVFRAVFRAASVGVKLVDLHTLRLVEANPSFEQLLGYQLEELRSRPYTDFTHPDDRAREAATYAKVEAGEGDTFQLEKRYKCK